MSPTFNVGKSIDDVHDPELMPEDWYPMEIVVEPIRELNAKQKVGGPEADGAGENIVLRLGVVSDIPEYNGRQLTKWLSLPNPSDEGKFTRQGQSQEDWKISIIAAWATAFGGKVEGEDVDFEIGGRAMVLIIQGLAQDGTTIENKIDFNSLPRAIAGEEVSPFAGERTQTTDKDDLPF